MADLPEIEYWKTRSFWLTIFTAGSVLAKPLGVHFDPALATNAAMSVVEVLPALTGVWAVLEAYKPANRVWKK